MNANQQTTINPSHVVSQATSMPASSFNPSDATGTTDSIHVPSFPPSSRPIAGAPHPLTTTTRIASTATAPAPAPGWHHQPPSSISPYGSQHAAMPQTMVESANQPMAAAYPYDPTTVTSAAMPLPVAPFSGTVDGLMQRPAPPLHSCAANQQRQSSIPPQSSRAPPLPSFSEYSMQPSFVPPSSTAAAATTGAVPPWSSDPAPWMSLSAPLQQQLSPALPFFPASDSSVRDYASTDVGSNIVMTTAPPDSPSLDPVPHHRHRHRHRGSRKRRHEHDHGHDDIRSRSHSQRSTTREQQQEQDDECELQPKPWKKQARVQKREDECERSFPKWESQMLPPAATTRSRSRSRPRHRPRYRSPAHSPQPHSRAKPSTAESIIPSPTPEQEAADLAEIESIIRGESKKDV